MSGKNKYLSGRLTAVLEAATLCLVASPVVASVISGDINIPVPRTTNGIYLNLLTGQNSTIANNVPGWDFNPFGSTKLQFYWSASTVTTTYAAGAATATTGGMLLNLKPGDVVDSSLIFAQGVPTTTAFQNTSYGYVGVKFTNESTGALNYGFVEMELKGPLGLGSTIVGYAYENSGNPISVESIEGIFINAFE